MTWQVERYQGRGISIGICISEMKCAASRYCLGFRWIHELRMFLFENSSLRVIVIFESA